MYNTYLCIYTHIMCVHIMYICICIYIYMPSPSHHHFDALYKLCKPARNAAFGLSEWVPHPMIISSMLNLPPNDFSNTHKVAPKLSTPTRRPFTLFPVGGGAVFPSPGRCL